MKPYDHKISVTLDGVRAMVIFTTPGKGEISNAILRFGDEVRNLIVEIEPREKATS